MALHSINTIELCAGGGMLGIGASLGFEMLGYRTRCVCYVEREAHAASALVARMEDKALDQSPVWDDIGTFDGGAWHGVVDCVIAGIPCQGNSLAGKRLLGDDPRNCWPGTRRILRDSDTGLFFLENVYGFIVPDRKHDREAPALRVLQELAEDGWNAEWLVLPASGVEANHQRRRFFLLAHHPRNAGGKRAGRKRILESGSALADERSIGRKTRGPRLHRQAENPEGRTAGDSLLRRSELPAVAVGHSPSDGRKGSGAVGRQGPQASAGAGLFGRAGGEFPGTAGDSNGAGLRQMQSSAAGWGQDAYDGCQDLPIFAPARNDFRGWVRVLSADASLVPALRRIDRSGVSSGTEAIKPGLRGLPDGLAQRVVERADRLRLGGNGVVAVQGAIAFVELWLRLFGGK